MTDATHTQNKSAENVLTIKQVYYLILDHLKFLLKFWVRILIVGIIGLIVGFSYAHFSTITYTANASFILEDGKSSSGGFSAIAGQLGFDLGSLSGSSSMLAGDNILGLLKSDHIIERALLTKVDSDSNTTLADFFAESNELQKGWVKDKRIGQKIRFPEFAHKSSFTRLQDSLLKTIIKRIKPKLSVERPEKKMTFINVSYTNKNEIFTKMFAEKLISEAVKFYIDTKIRRQKNNVDRLQSRADSIENLLNSRTYSSALAQSQSLDLNPAYQVAGINAENASRNKIMIGTIYGEVIKNLEIHKANLTQETPVIQLVDQPSLPLFKNKLSRIKFGIIGGFLSGFMICGFLILKRKK